MAIYNMLCVVFVAAMLQVIAGQGYEGRGVLGGIGRRTIIDVCPAHLQRTSEVCYSRGQHCSRGGTCYQSYSYCCLERHIISSGLGHVGHRSHATVHRPRRPAVGHSGVGHVSHGSDYCTNHYDCPTGYSCCSDGYCQFSCPRITGLTPRRVTRRRRPSVSGGVFPVNY